jgi:ATPase subunit of ABC transporter with duplicated ATPase domains
VRVGYLPQEPQLDPDQDVRGNVMEGVAAKKALVDRYNEIAANYSDETADEMAKLQDEIEAKGLWDLDSQVDQAMDALRCPMATPTSTKLSGGERAASRCASCCSTRPTCCCSTSRPTISTPNRWLARSTTLREYPGCVLLVTHDRYFLDNVTGWILELDRGKGIPHEGNYSSFLARRKSASSRKAARKKRRQRTLAREREWIAIAQGAPGQVQGAHQRL